MAKGELKIKLVNAIAPAVAAINNASNLIQGVKEQALLVIDKEQLAKQPPMLTPPTPTTQATGVIQSVVSPFGNFPNNVNNCPNDAVVLTVSNNIDVALDLDYRISTYIKANNDLTLNVEQDVLNLGYISGKYKVRYDFYRNILGSGDGHKIEIQEISSDGLEARVVAATHPTLDGFNFKNFFSSGLFNTPKSQILPNLSLYKQDGVGVVSFRVFDYIQDKLTVGIAPYSIILKFNSPLPTSIGIGDSVWLAQQLGSTVNSSITIIPPKPKQKLQEILGPNWDYINKTQTTVTTTYKDWDDILSTNAPTAESIINNLLSGSLVEGIELNTDYRSFSNYITLGSATERLENFKYKLSLLQRYDNNIKDLTINLPAISGSISASLVYQTNIVNAKTKRAALIGSFDGYEKYLYVGSSSYESSSYGEFYPTTWPKSGITSGSYINYPTTASQAVEWFSGIYESASLYDNNNDQSLIKLVPAHVRQDDSNDQYILLVNMMGHYFDIMLQYIKQMTSLSDRNQSIYEGFSKELIYNAAKSLGVDFENGSALDDLWAYSLGTSATGSLVSTYGVGSESRVKETWKRIINNLPYLLKTKGTERGVRALINCYGIPQTILRIREYGGAEPEFDTKTDLQYERFNYAHKILSVNDASFTASFIGVPEPYLLEWGPTTTLHNGLKPMAIQLRVKFAKNQTSRQWIFGTEDVFNSEVYNTGPSGAQNWKVEAFYSASNSYIGFFLKGTQGWATASVSSSIYDGTFHSITLQRSVASDISSSNQTYTLIAKKVNYDKVVATQTASLSINGATSSSYNKSFVSGSNSYLLFGATSASFTGTSSMQEFRLWTTPLDDNILDNHALAPTSFQGNTDGVSTGSTSSYSDLAFRLCLGSDNKRPQYLSPVFSQHPNQNELKFGNGTEKYVLQFGVQVNVPAASASLLWEPIIEKHSLEWPDLGGNRSVGTKIRIESTSTAGETELGNTIHLWKDNSVQRSLADTQPPDSPRLGVYLSPQNEINQDIAEQFGGISIDDYIGDPSYAGLDTYPGLDRLKMEYSKKFTSGRNKPQNYIRLLKYYDASLFQLIKKYVPYRANLQTGLVIEPTIIERSKVRTAIPTYEYLHYSASIDTTAAYTTTGAVQDADAEPNRDQPYWANNGYVDDGVIGQLDQYTISGDEQDVAEYHGQAAIETFPEIQGDEQDVGEYHGQEPIDLAPEFVGDVQDIIQQSNIETLKTCPTFEATNKQFTTHIVGDTPSRSGSFTAEIDTAISHTGRDTRVMGSQYTFMTWAISGSGPTHSPPFMITSSHTTPITTIITDSRYSEIYNDINQNYSNDVFAGRAFTGARALETATTIFSSSDAVQNNLWTSQYGMRLLPNFTGSNPGIATSSIDPTVSVINWAMNKTSYEGLGLYLVANSYLANITGSVSFDTFYYKQGNPQTAEILYDVSITVQQPQMGFTPTTTLHLFFGKSGSAYTQTITSIPATLTTYSFRTKADGNQLIIASRITSVNHGIIAPIINISKLSVQPVNYRAQVQDYELTGGSVGMANSKYNGCKLTATDYNVDSLDTVDGGPVISVTVLSGKQIIKSKQSKKGGLDTI